MRLRAILVAVALVATPASALAGGGKPARRLGAAYAKKRAANQPPPAPFVVVQKRSRAQSAGMSCRSRAKG